ncbi:cellobiose dehydrogenase [Colletotrichum karsti]|uniref:Cellobiose dehydrogenase n=1 Tax=Colletotrichum karsti TaxID=1095194 RepID=A0A9P6HZY5_9PEZI|nr:cellobiose dehydrogenase [Colletotrichum karsti]KAF9873754.1 cellobiose dehydrogenase [Colletotrichum karsti]
MRLEQLVSVAGLLLRSVANASPVSSHNSIAARDGDLAATDRLVFAHFMVGIVGLRNKVSDYDVDFKRAKEVGIDAFALNIGKDPYTETQLDLAYEAAVNNGLKVFISFDFNWYKPKTEADVVGGLIAKYANKPGQLIVDGKIFASSYAGDGLNVTAMREAVAANTATEVFWAPNFHPPTVPSLSGQPYVETSEGLDGALNWYAWDTNGQNKAPTAGANVSVQYTDSEYIKWLQGKPYIAPVSAWFFTHYGPEVSYSKNFVFPGDLLWARRWQDVLSLGPRFVEIVSWNDFGESHYVAPLGSSHNDDGGSKWTLGMPHDGWLDMAKPFIRAFKSGATTVDASHIDDDQLVYWYRPNPSTTSCDATDTTFGRPANNDSGNYFEGRPNGWQTLSDSVFVVSLLKEPAMVTVRSGNNTQNFSASEGTNFFQVPIGLGVQSFAVSRDGKAIVSATSSKTISNSCICGLYNYNAYVGTVPEKTWTDLSGASLDSLATGLAGRVACSLTAQNTSYDYIVVGGGAAGLVVSDRLSEAGHTVLLLERGPPSSGRWIPAAQENQVPFDNWRPGWLNGTNLTRFDVPGLSQYFWSSQIDIACADQAENPAACVLGGSTAVNSALWWRPPAGDFDENGYPHGWGSADMRGAVGRAFARMPATDRPSPDGILYSPEGYNVVAGALAKAGWANVTGNETPDAKNRTFSYANYHYRFGYRNGPMDTYLVTASARPNFALWTDTSVRRVIRDGGRVTGVEIEGSGRVVNVTCGTGRVVLSAGYFGSPKILFRSGIGPEDQLKVVAESQSDGSSFIDRGQWLQLPVGKNLKDHQVTDFQISHPSVKNYDWSNGIWDAPVQGDLDQYLRDRSGMLAGPPNNHGPMAWETLEGSLFSDNTPRQIQWTTRIQNPGPPNNLLTLSSFVGRGSSTVGRLAINGNMTISYAEIPYFQTEDDKKAAVIAGERMVAALRANPEITLVKPAPNQTVADYVNSIAISVTARRGLHLMGTARMGTDSGLNGGEGYAVVDSDAKVYGTENLFVVDASIMPGMVTANPTGAILSVAERAAERILNLPPDRLKKGITMFPFIK